MDWLDDMLLGNEDQQLNTLDYEYYEYNKNNIEYAFKLKIKEINDAFEVMYLERD